MGIKKAFKEFFQPKRFIFVNIGLLLTAIGVYFFKSPNGFTVGGVSGLSIAIARIIQGINPNSFFTMGVINFILNALMLLIGFAFLGRGVAVSTVLCSFIYSFEIWALETWLPIDKFPQLFPYGTMTDEPFFELVIATLVGAVGASFLFQYGASSGGTDILALILQKFTKLKVGMALLCVDFVIAASAFWLFGATIGLYSMAGLFAKTFVVDGVIESMNVCKCFMIITSHPELIEPYITHTLKHTATRCQVTGIYSQTEKQMIITVCKRSEAVILKRCIKQVDPQAFLIVTSSNEIIGRGFNPL